MRFTTSAAACMALIGRAFTQTDGFDAIINPTEDEVLDAGSTYQITWDYNDQYPGPISISLLQGASSSTLEVAETLANGIDSSIGSYSWTVGSELGDAATYAIKISLNSDPNIFQYSFPFEIAASGEGGLGSTSSSTPQAVIVVSTATYSSLSAPLITAAPPSNFSSGYSSGYSGGYSGEYSPSNTSITSGAGAVTFSTHIATGGINETTTATGTTTAHKHAHVTKTTLTSIVSASSTGAATTKKAPSMAESGAGRVLAGALVAMGGLAMALLVL